jgi:hypothetical protein
MLCTVYVCSWLIFATVYYSIALSRANCFKNMHNFNAALVFSISSQE